MHARTHVRTHRRQNTWVDTQQLESTDLKAWKGSGAPFSLSISLSLILTLALRGPVVLTRLEFLRDSLAFVVEVVLVPVYGNPCVPYDLVCVFMRRRARARRESSQPNFCLFDHHYLSSKASFENRDWYRDRWRRFLFVHNMEDDPCFIIFFILNFIRIIRLAESSCNSNSSQNIKSESSKDLPLLLLVIKLL